MEPPRYPFPTITVQRGLGNRFGPRKYLAYYLFRTSMWLGCYILTLVFLGLVPARIIGCRQTPNGEKVCFGEALTF